jgi:hypothetical protein
LEDKNELRILILESKGIVAGHIYDQLRTHSRILEPEFIEPIENEVSKTVVKLDE